jgi:hypothetical protein
MIFKSSNFPTDHHASCSLFSEQSTLYTCIILGRVSNHCNEDCKREENCHKPFVHSHFESLIVQHSAIGGFKRKSQTDPWHASSVAIIKKHSEDERQSRRNSCVRLALFFSCSHLYMAATSLLQRWLFFEAGMKFNKYKKGGAVVKTIIPSPATYRPFIWMLLTRLRFVVSCRAQGVPM